LTRTASNESAQQAYQASVDAVGVNAGKPLARGVSAADDVTIKAASATLAAARLNAEMIKQVTIQIAKDTLRASGDTAPA
jgi:hypothetical protein